MNSPVHLTFCFRSVFDYFFSIGQTLELGLLSVQVSSQSQRIGVSFLKQQPFPGVQALDPLKDRHMAGARSFCQEINNTDGKLETVPLFQQPRDFLSYSAFKVRAK